MNVRDPTSGASAATPIRVMAVDDHPLFIEGISSVLAAERNIRLVAAARSGMEALQRYRETRPDVTLMDIEMPELDGIETTALILAEFPLARVIVLSTYEGDGFLARAVQAGAYGYVTKCSLRRDLVSMVHCVHAGQHVTNLKAAKVLCKLLPAEDLTARELDVLRLVAVGRTNKLVGESLSITEETVKTHMRSILPKLSANDRTHAVTLAIAHGILPMPRIGDGNNKR